MRCGAARCGAITGEDAGCRARRRSACCASGAADLIADTVRSVPHIIRADEVSRSAAAAGARCAAIDGTTERLADYIARPARRSVRLGRAARFARGATRNGVDAAFRLKAAATGDPAAGINPDPAQTAAKRTAQ